MPLSIMRCVWLWVLNISRVASRCMGCSAWCSIRHVMRSKHSRQDTLTSNAEAYKDTARQVRLYSIFQQQAIQGAFGCESIKQQTSNKHCIFLNVIVKMIKNHIINFWNEDRNQSMNMLLNTYISKKLGF